MKEIKVNEITQKSIEGWIISKEGTSSAGKQQKLDYYIIEFNKKKDLTDNKNKVIKVELYDKEIIIKVPNEEDKIEENKIIGLKYTSYDNIIYTIPIKFSSIKKK